MHRMVAAGIMVALIVACSSPSEAGWSDSTRSKNLSSCKVAAKLSLKRQGMLDTMGEIIPAYCACMMKQTEAAVPDYTDDPKHPYNVAGTPENTQVMQKIASIGQQWTPKCMEIAADEVTE